MESRIATAMQKGYFHQVRMLVKRGLEVNEADNNGRTPLMLCSLVEDNCWAVGLARTLLDGGAHTSQTDTFGRTAIHYACIFKRTNLLRVLLAAIDDDVNRTDRCGNTALHYAAATGNTDTTGLVLNACLRYGYRVDVSNRDHLTPLMMAFKEEYFNCANLIREATRKLTERDEKRNELIKVKVSEAAKAMQVTHALQAARKLTINFDKRIDFKSDRVPEITENMSRQERPQLRRSGVDLCNGLITHIAPQTDYRRYSLGPHVNKFLHQRQPRASFSHLIVQWKDREIVAESNTVLDNLGASNQRDSIFEPVKLTQSDSDNPRSSLHFHPTTATSAREKRVSAGGQSGGRTSQISVTVSGGRSAQSALSSNADKPLRVCSRHAAHHAHTHKSISLSLHPAADIIELKTIAMVGAGQPRNNPNKLASIMLGQQPHELFILSDNCIHLDIEHIRNNTTPIDTTTDNSWRSSVGQMYQVYGYQFTSSFCSRVRPHAQRSVTSTVDSELDADSILTPGVDTFGCSRRSHLGRRSSARRKSSIRLGLDMPNGRGTRK